MTKKETRLAAKEAFEAWCSSVQQGPENASRAIWDKVEASTEFRNAATVLVYMSVRGEVLTDEFIKKWHPAKRIAIPLVCGENLRLKLYEPGHLTQGYRGITEPAEDAIDIAPSEIDFAIVPGAAFSVKEGKVMRLGRGGGFYDRLLPTLDCPTAAVCYRCRILEDIPSDPWDAPLDKIFSE